MAGIEECSFERATPRTNRQPLAETLQEAFGSPMVRGAPYTARSPSWMSRLFTPMSPGGIRGTVINLTASMLGAGILTLPFAMRETGLIMGTLMVIFSGVISTVSILILAVATTVVTKPDPSAVTTHKITPAYSAVVRCFVGDGAAILADIMVMANGVGTGIAFLVFIGDFLPSACRGLMLYPDLDIYFFRLLGNRMVAIALGCVLIWPLCVQKHLSALRYVALLPVTSVLIFCVVVASRVVQYSTMDLAGDRFYSAASEILWPTPHAGLRSFLLSYAIFVFAFYQHSVVVPVASEIENPTSSRLVKVGKCAALVQIPMYLCVSLSGVTAIVLMPSRQPSDPVIVEQNFVENFADNDLAMLVCRLLLTLSLLLSLPSNIIAVTRSFFGLVQACSLFFRRRFLASQLGPSTNFSEPLLDHETTWNQTSNITVPTLQRVAAATAFLALCMLVALSTNQIGGVVGLIGGIFATTLMCTIPAMIVWVAQQQCRSDGIQKTNVSFALLVVLLSSCALAGYSSSCLEIWIFLQKLGS